MRKLLTRTLTLCTTLILVYFVVISDDTGKIPTEHRTEQESNAQALSKGEDVRVRVFNLEGEKVSEGTFHSIAQENESRFLVEAPKVTYTSKKGRKIHLRGDYLDSEQRDRHTLSSKPGGMIQVQEEGGITIDTVGPLIYNPENDTLSTVAPATFSMANFSGHCTGLTYRSEDFLHLESEVLFKGDDGVNGKVEMKAIRMELNLKNNEGHLNEGTITSVKGSERTQIESELALFHFVGDGKKVPYSMTDMLLKGSPARFHWGLGEIAASRFEGCFDVTGKWLEDFTTSEDAVFSSVSEDGYRFSGQGGRITIFAKEWNPTELFSADKIVLRGQHGDGPELYLEGNGGLQSLFEGGKATSTRIFGTPTFRYGNQEGVSGSLRLLHHEHQILFSEGAELNDRVQALRVKGDEILLANWDQEAREIFAYDFVEIERFAGTPQQVRCFANELEMHLPSGSLTLGGNPARVIRDSDSLEGKTIVMRQVETNLFDIVVEQGVRASMLTDEGTYLIESRKMNYSASQRLLTFENVLRATAAERGELSGGLLQIWLAQKDGQLALDHLQMTRDVVFKGSRLIEGVPSPLTCQADEMTYKVSEEIIYFNGKNRDVVFSDAQAETRNRVLMYNLKDGSLSGTSARNRTTTTTVPLLNSQGTSTKGP